MNGYQKDMCDDEIGLYAPNIVIIIGPKRNTIGSAYLITQRGIFALDSYNF